ncbi:MAG: hypothetical protein AAF568_06125 [Pseudomonadota bacterium]
MTDETLLAEAVEALLTQIEADVEALDEARMRVASLQTRRLSLTRALEGAYTALPLELRGDFDARIMASAIATAAETDRVMTGDLRQQAVIRYLAQHRERTIKVAEVQSALEAQGLMVPKGYASAALKSLSKQGLCYRLRQGRYMVSEVHPEILYGGMTRDLAPDAPEEPFAIYST